MLPVVRWFLCCVGALWSLAVGAQGSTPQPEVDESKIPEWVKRQARSPYKVIIESNTVKVKPAPVAAKEDAGAKAAVKKVPVKTAAPAASVPAAAVAANAGAIAVPQNAAIAPLPVLPEAAAAVPQALPPEAVKNASTVLAPAALPPRAAAPELTALVLLKRVEPLLSADLLDSRLNTAKVVVAFTVSASGEVSNLSIASTTDSRLNRSVLRALQGWRYAPIAEPREHRVSFAFAME